MMLSYVTAFIRNNKFKTMLMAGSLSIYFLLISIAATMSRSIDDVAALPMKRIGAQTVVQKAGEIPSQMVGAIFPHSNAPIYENEIKQIASAPFVTDFDQALYFWYFDNSYFKSVLGFHLDKGLYTDVLKASLIRGNYPAGYSAILVTQDFVKKQSLDINDTVKIGERHFTISGVLRSDFNGNIAPADIYMDIHEAQQIAGDSAEMKTLYNFTDTRFYNMVVLKTDPLWQGSKKEVILSYNKKLLVFGEESFKKEVADQLTLLSSSASLAFIILGILLVIGFSLMILYGIKSRENEIALLRMLGWKFSALRSHFIGESMVLTAGALILGNLWYIASLLYLSMVSVSIELPWDISAKPHFLPDENSIERVITAPLPVDAGILPQIGISIGMLAVCAALTFVVLYKLKNIKPAEFYKN